MMLQRVQVRRRAAQMLLVWLLTLASGLLNACTITPGQMHVVHLAASTMPAVSMPFAEHCSECPPQAGQASPTPCSKACSDASGAAVSAEVGFDAAAGVQFALLPTFGLQLATRAVQLVDAVLPQLTVASAAPPLHISLLRLAL